MCVQGCKSGALTRAEVVASIAGASLFAFGKPASAAASAPRDESYPELPEPPSRLSAGASYAVGYARGSDLIVRSFGELQSLARSIADGELRTQVRSFLENPAPRYAARLRDAAVRDTVRSELLQAGYIERLDAIDAFLPGASQDFSQAPQPFWATAGSGQDSHHAYPGGLVLHELFNARAAVALAADYDRTYFGGVRTISRDTVVAAALYHDVMKTVVFQWNVDGRLSIEPNIAGTGAHHVLSGAEAIARGHDARFVTVVLSAHAAPSLGDETKVIAWATAAAMIAGVDPVEYGLLKRSGTAYVLAQPPPIEAFINNLSDHDYVLSVHAMHEVAPRLDALMISKFRSDGTLWRRNGLLANTSAIRWYEALSRGERAFEALVRAELAKAGL